VELSRECQKQLEEAESRVEILLKKADGKLVAEPFEPEKESEKEISLETALKNGASTSAAMKLPEFFEEDRLAVDAALEEFLHKYPLGPLPFIKPCAIAFLPAASAFARSFASRPPGYSLPILPPPCIRPVPSK